MSLIFEKFEYCPLSRSLLFHNACSCGHVGVRSRSRDCVGPVDGGTRGRECPKKTDKQWESCGEPCWTDYTEWSQCKGNVCGKDYKQ